MLWTTIQGWCCLCEPIDAKLWDRMALLQLSLPWANSIWLAPILLERTEFELHTNGRLIIFLNLSSLPCHRFWRLQRHIGHKAAWGSCLFGGFHLELPGYLGRAFHRTSFRVPTGWSGPGASGLSARSMLKMADVFTLIFGTQKSSHIQ